MSPSHRRQYKDHFTHQYHAVSHQTDEGLRAIKRTAAFFEHATDIQVTSTEAALKAMKQTRDKYADLKDECTHYVNASMMVEEVMEHTEKTQLVLSQSIQNELVKPMRTWYKANAAKKEKLDKDMTKLNQTLKTTMDDINKERKACQLAFAELKKEQLARVQLETAGQSGTDAHNKQKAKHAKLKEATFKKFQQFDAKLSAARGAQLSYYTKDVPAKLSELEAIERDRLSYQQECYVKFQAIFNTYTTALKSSSELMNKVLPTLNINKAMNLLFDKWSAAFGPPPALQQIPYDLPCLASDIQSEVLDSQGPPPGNGPASPLTPSAAAGGSAPYSPPSQYGASYGQPPPPPPAAADDDGSNPFASDSAAPSGLRSMNPHSDAGAGGGGGGGGANGEAPLFWAEGLFDFELQNDGGDITYVNFKAGDRIAVFQEGDEWWYGEVGGHSGFFPSNYSKRL